jgi:hypothetical protein
LSQFLEKKNSKVLRACLNIVFLTEKDRFFPLDKAYFAGVAGSYDEKIQRSIVEKAAFIGRITIFKQTLTYKI